VFACVLIDIVIVIVIISCDYYYYYYYYYYYNFRANLTKILKRRINNILKNKNFNLYNKNDSELEKDLKDISLKLAGYNNYNNSYNNYNNRSNIIIV
jgi:hypothetical protein